MIVDCNPPFAQNEAKMKSGNFAWLLCTRLAHFSHFSREREMVLRDISREKCDARNCEKNQLNSGQFGAQFDQKLTIFQVKSLTFWNRLMYHFYLLLFSSFGYICHTSIKYISDWTYL